MAPLQAEDLAWLQVAQAAAPATCSSCGKLCSLRKSDTQSFLDMSDDCGQLAWKQLGPSIFATQKLKPVQSRSSTSNHCFPCFACHWRRVTANNANGNDCTSDIGATLVTQGLGIFDIVPVQQHHSAYKTIDTTMGNASSLLLPGNTTHINCTSNASLT
jgi:hypothetical protein